MPDNPKSPFHGRAPRSWDLMRERAGELRKRMSPPEAYLWKHLKAKQVGGFYFNRQKPLGPYIADFYCHEARLVVEVDGKQHAEQAAYDAARDRWMKENGLAVLRLQASIVWNDMATVITFIKERLEARITGK